MTAMLLGILILVVIVTVPLRLFARDMNSAARGIDHLEKAIRPYADAVERGEADPLAVRFWKWIKRAF